MSPGLLNPFAMKTISSAYKATALATNPWGFWLLNESGTASNAIYADSTTNNRDMRLSITGGAPTPSQPGPSPLFPAVKWPSADSTFLDTTGVGAFFNSATGTCGIWVYLTAAPPVGSPVQLIACQNNGVGSVTKYLRINAAQTVSFGITSSTRATSTLTVPLNTWTWVVGSVGAAGTKIRINKTTSGTLANTSSSTTGLAASIHKHESSSIVSSGSILYTAAGIVWASQQSDATTDSLYDAMFA